MLFFKLYIETDKDFILEILKEKEQTRMIFCHESHEFTRSLKEVTTEEVLLG
jgi:predicted house-cleaning noncanonical NTP pyrophosphatase (MazG superfamily)